MDGKILCERPQLVIEAEEDKGQQVFDPTLMQT